STSLLRSPTSYPSLSFTDPSPPPIYTLSLTTLFRSPVAPRRRGSTARDDRDLPRLGRPHQHRRLCPRHESSARRGHRAYAGDQRSEEHTSELQSRENLVCRLLLEKKNNKKCK